MTVVIVAHNEGRNVLLTVEALRYSTDRLYPVVVVDDGSWDGCCDFLRSRREHYPHVELVTVEREGAARARNVGAARVATPYLVFLDAHCFPQRGWLRPLLEAARTTRAGIVAPRISVAGNHRTAGFGVTFGGPDLSVSWLAWQDDAPYAVPAAGAGCMLMKTETFHAVGRFDSMRLYGLEDVELSIRAWVLGHEVVVVPTVEVAHVFKSYTGFHVGWDNYLYNILRTSLIHFRGSRLDRVLTAHEGHPEYSRVLRDLLTGDVWERRAFVDAHRERTGDSYCDHFSIEL